VLVSDRPYRTYKGGKVRPDGKSGTNVAVPEAPPERRGAIELPPPGAPPPIEPPRFRWWRKGDSPGWRPTRREPRSLKFWIVLMLVIAGVLLLSWLTLGLLAVRSSVTQANERLDPRARAALAPAGALLAEPTTILLIGVDDQANSDTLQVLRFDPARQLQSTLAIPRDLRVNVPGYGDDKINAAYAAGGSALAIKTVSEYTGLPIEHVMVIDFEGLEQVVDAVGGITVDNPGNIRSVFGAELYTFPKGRITLNGAEALAYARVRKNILNPADSDVSRGQRQQAVIQALRAKVASPGGLLRLRNVATSLGGTFATDLTLWQFLQLGYLDARASRKLRCNLGGTPAPLDGQDMLIPDGAGNRRVLGEFLGNAAVQPAASRSIFAAKCRTA
jgi:LCP family protein required for cell wall assembly